MDEAPNDLKQQRLAEVLIDFGRSPGKYPVRLGEPRELHAGLDTLTYWALGRLPQTLHAQAIPLRDAAILFIARACFAPDATHYQMLGLTPAACTPEAMRVRYRNLIRLTHPDMGTKGLPPNAAGALNRAQGVLSDPELRRRYDDELADRQTSASTAERERAARSQSPRRIEHRVTLAERWQSLKARYPNLGRLGAIAAGIAVLSAGLLAVALNSHNDDRVLIAARETDKAPRERPARKADPITERRTDQAATASRQASALPAAPPSAPPSAPPPAASPVMERSTPPVAIQTEAALASEARGSAVKADSREAAPKVAASEIQTGTPPDDAKKLVLDRSARLKEPDTKRAGLSGDGAVVAERGRTPDPTNEPSRGSASPASNTKDPAAQEMPVRPAPPSTTSAAAAPMPPTEPRRAPTLRREPEPASTQATAATSDRIVAPIRPGSAQPTASATTPAANASQRAPTAPATVAAASTVPANQVGPGVPPGPGGQVWSVDANGAMSYLSELVSMLETPNAAYRTNAYLTQMKVKGSLFQPALKIMRDFSDIDISRVDWSDSSAPGVLKVRGTVVLQARSSQPPFSRVANFRLSAEFWGTPTGTVLAELNLRETE